jgi:cysteinyl-tRNA synthetase
MKKIRCLLLFVYGLTILSGCNDDIDPVYRQHMREFVIAISNYAKDLDPEFIVIPQNGIELITTNGEADGATVQEYLQAIEANGQEDLFFGYDRDNEPTSNDDNNYLTNFLDVSKEAGKVILVTDYCSTSENMDASYASNYEKGYISFAASHRELDNIPAYPAAPFHENDRDITSLNNAANFLYLINPQNYATKDEFIEDMAATNYDVIIMDLFLTQEISFNNSDLNRLKHKSNGGLRLVICYMSVGEAENYRYYWQTSWDTSPPSWMDRENPDWEGNFKVKYWESGWQSIIYGNEDSYLDKIITAGFDGIYLDIIDAYENFE